MKLSVFFFIITVDAFGARDIIVVEVIETIGLVLRA